MGLAVTGLAVLRVAVLAHQGGWDEILFVLLPIGIFAGLLAVANRRASQLPNSQDPEIDPADEGPADEDPAGGPDRA